MSRRSAQYGAGHTLMAKEQDLGCATRMQSEQSDEPSTEQFEEVDHLGKATALLAYASPDKILSRHG